MLWKHYLPGPQFQPEYIVILNSVSYNFKVGNYKVLCINLSPPRSDNKSVILHSTTLLEKIPMGEN